MTKKLAMLTAVLLVGLAILLVGVRQRTSRRYRAVEYQHLVGLNRQEVEEELGLGAVSEWSSSDSFWHGTINQLDLRGMSVVCYGEGVVSVEPNER
jgi:hypothetical protein